MLKRRFPCMALLVLMMATSLSACAAQAEPPPSIISSRTATMTPMLPTATFTAPPTFTPEPPTSTPEPTATPEPTEIPKVKLSADIDNPASVPWEDLMAGRIEPAEPVVFADDAQFEIRYKDGTTTQCDPIVSHVEQLGLTYLNVGKHYRNPEMRPVQIVGFGRTTELEMGWELVVVLEAVHNRDGSVGRWTFLLDVEQFESLKRFFMNGSSYLVPMQVDKKFRDSSYIVDYGSNELHAVAHRTAPDLLVNIGKFVVTGIWETGMDRPMAGYFSQWTP